MLALGPLVLVSSLHFQDVAPAVPGRDFILRNGLHVSLVPLPGARTFAVAGRVDAGAIYEPPCCPGLSGVAVQWLASPVIGESALSPAVHWSGQDGPTGPVSNRWLEFRATGFAGDLGAVLSVLEQRLTFAARGAEFGVPPERWDVLRAVAAERARDILSRVEGQLQARALAAFYPAGSPFALLPWGPADGVAGGPEDLRAFLRDHVTPARTRLVIAGDVAQDRLLPSLEETLGRIPPGGPRATPPPNDDLSAPQAWDPRWASSSGASRAHILAIYPAQPARPADELATRALVSILGDSWRTGRLADTLLKSGLASMAWAGLAEDVGSGFLYLRVATEPLRVDRVLTALRATLDALGRGQIAAPEVAVFLERERSEQASGDPPSCAERELHQRPGCGSPPAALSLQDVVSRALRLFAQAPVVIVIEPPGASAP